MQIEIPEYRGYEDQYIDILKKIHWDGYAEVNERTNIEMRRIPHAIMQVDLQKEFPILQCKFVAWKVALKEILWIMQSQSNNIRDLDATIWDSWADESGSIGKSYGYQIHKPVIGENGQKYESQVHYVLDRLAVDPSDRRSLLMLWDVDELHEMNLVPCCFSSIWSVVDGKLNCVLVQRSGDFLVGVPFNTTQYAMLQILFARHLRIKPGLLTHVIADAHYYYGYRSHREGADEMIRRYEEMPSFEDRRKPEFIVEPGEDKFDTNFFRTSLHQCHVTDYKHMGQIAFDVAV